MKLKLVAVLSLSVVYSLSAPFALFSGNRLAPKMTV